METKEQFTNVLKELKPEQRSYLERLFQNCPKEVIKSMRYRKVPKGYVLIHAGTECDSVYIILKGNTVGMDFQKLGNAYVVREDSCTDILGDFELLGDIKEYRITIRTATDCEVVVIPAAIYLKWMQQDINALFMRTRKLMNSLTLEAATERKYLFLNCKDRLILHLVEEYEAKGRGEVYRLKNTQPELADRLGFNTRTIQRSIQNLEQSELIAIERGKICIALENYQKLKEYVAEHLLN